MATSRKPSREDRGPDRATPPPDLEENVSQPGATTDQGTIVDRQAANKSSTRDAQVTSQGAASDAPVAAKDSSSSYDRVTMMGRSDDYGQGVADAAEAVQGGGADVVTRAGVDLGVSHRIDGIDGESADDAHESEIDLEFGAGAAPEPEATKETAVARHDGFPDALAGGPQGARASRHIEAQSEADELDADSASAICPRCGVVHIMGVCGSIGGDDAVAVADVESGSQEVLDSSDATEPDL